jgi:hypothetical protein
MLLFFVFFLFDNYLFVCDDFVAKLLWIVGWRNRKEGSRRRIVFQIANRDAYVGNPTEAVVAFQ